MPCSPDFRCRSQACPFSLQHTLLWHFQIAGLKKLAKKDKTTISSELSNAVDAYLLDLSRDEIRLLGHFADLTKTSLFVGNQKITGILREIDQSTARITRLERRAARARNTKQR